jgi:hypothetical protein
MRVFDAEDRMAIMRWICASVCLVIGVASTSSVWAEDYTFPGIACRYGGSMSNDGYLQPYNITEIKNVSGQAVDVNCPITSSNNGRKIRAVLNASVDSAWDHTNCTFAQNSYDGFTYFAWPTPSLTQVGASYQFLWNWITYPTSQQDFSSYTIHCKVPPNQSIYKYDMQHTTP